MTLGAATVAVDPAQSFQTVDGLGAFASIPQLLRPAGQFYLKRPEDYDVARFTQDLGVSAVRFEIPPECYPVEGEDYDWQADAYGAGDVTAVLALMRRLRTAGCNRFILSAWSPPCWMKTNGSCFDGGSLRPEYESAFAGFVADYCMMIRELIDLFFWSVDAFSAA